MLQVSSTQPRLHCPSLAEIVEDCNASRKLSWRRFRSLLCLATPFAWRVQWDAPPMMSRRNKVRLHIEKKKRFGGSNSLELIP